MTQRGFLYSKSFCNASYFMEQALCAKTIPSFFILASPSSIRRAKGAATEVARTPLRNLRRSERKGIFTSCQGYQILRDARGKESTSLIFLTPVKYIIIRSKPRPWPSFACDKGITRKPSRFTEDFGSAATTRINGIACPNDCWRSAVQSPRTPCRRRGFA